MILALDIGGTKVAVASFARAGRDLEPKAAVRRHVTKDFVGLDGLLEAHFGGRLPEDLDAVAVGLAGPVLGRQVELTNLPWRIDADQLEARLGCPVFLLNDLAAHAYAVPLAKPEHAVCLRAGLTQPGNIALIAAGTGLGEAILFRDGDRYVASASEGGHTSFSPTSPEELELLAFLWKQHHHVSWERVCSGLDGFRSLYEFLSASGRITVPPSDAERFAGERDLGAYVLQAAETGQAFAKEIVRWFLKLYAAEAGNLALKSMAVGGVYFAGGIAPRLLAEMQRPEFLDHFAAKGRFRGLLNTLPLFVLTDPLAALRGAAAFARQRLS